MADIEEQCDQGVTSDISTDTITNVPVNGNVDGKKEQVTGRLQKREDERLADQQKRREKKENVTATNENADFFLSNFNTSRGEIESVLNNSASVTKTKLADHFDSLILSVQKLQKFVSDSTMFLPSYEVQKAQETIGKLQASIYEKRDLLIPKKKFAFKSKKKGGDNKVADGKAEEAKSKKVLQVAITDCNFADISSQTLVKTADEATDKDVALARLNDCVVKIYGSPIAAHINKLENCKVLCGPVSGSILIEDCKNCIFVLACQQLRIHSTTETSFYIHVTSKAIIEDCNTVKFAPNNWKYPTISQDYDKSGLDQSRNNWNDVDDFNWLASDKSSPNWAVLPEDDRIKSWEL